MVNINESKLLSTRDAEEKIKNDIMREVDLSNCDVFVTDFETYVKVYNDKFVHVKSEDTTFYGYVELITTLLLLRKKVQYHFTDESDMKEYEKAIIEKLNELR